MTLEHSISNQAVLGWLNHSAPFGVYTTDTTLQITLWNQWLELKSGLKSKEMIGKNLLESFPQMIEKGLDQVYTQVLAGEEISLKGEKAPFPYLQQDARVAPLYANERVIGTITLLEEVTTRILENRELKNRVGGMEAHIRELGESERQFRTLTENSLAGVYLIQDDRFIYVNPAFAEIFGYQPQELIKMHQNELVSPEERERVQENLRKRISGEVDKIRYQFQGMRKDRTFCHVEVLGTRTMINERPAILGTLIDITEQKEAEERLRFSEEKLSKAFRASPDWMTISTLSEGRYIDVNDAYLEMTGYQREEVLGRTAVSLGIWVDLNLRREVARALNEKGSIRNFETQFRMKSGEIKTMSLSGEVIHLKGEEWVIFACRDISELKKAKERLEHSLDSLRKSMGAIIQAMTRAVEVRDPYTAGHQRRVADLARTIAQEMGIPENLVDGLRMAGAIHDLGKISIPTEILSKPTRLSEVEMDLIRLHPQSGYEILKGIEFPWPIAQIVYQHHERMDGSGYPQGLKGEEILLEARILAVADVVEAMATHRPYRPALGITKALKHIAEGKGSLYDTRVVEACQTLFRKKRYKLTH